MTLQPTGLGASQPEPVLGTQTPPLQSGVQTQVPVASSHRHPLDRQLDTGSHTQPASQPPGEQPCGFGPSHATGCSSGTQVPPPQSSVQIQPPVSSSQVHCDGRHPSSSQAWPSGQPVCLQPAGFGPSQPIGPASAWVASSVVASAVVASASSTSSEGEVSGIEPSGPSASACTSGPAASDATSSCAFASSADTAGSPSQPVAPAASTSASATTTTPHRPVTPRIPRIVFSSRRCRPP